MTNKLHEIGDQTSKTGLPAVPIQSEAQGMFDALVHLGLDGEKLVNQGRVQPRLVGGNFNCIHRARGLALATLRFYKLVAAKS